MKILFLSACILWCSSTWITCEDLQGTTTTSVDLQSDFVRTGVCPRISSTNGQDSESECLDSTPQCEADVDCGEEQKCCHNGCSRVCVYPSYTGCQQLRALLERQEQFSEEKTNIFVPKCKINGEFENIQCSNITGKCWCVDSLGFELSGTRANSLGLVNCKAPRPCADVLCRMLCPYGFQLDSEGCPLCKCRNPCEGVECPAGQECQLEEIPCAEDACPPLPTCKQPRTLEGLCPVGTPLSSPDSGNPFLCGVEPNKPQCPPSYLCDVMPGNDYGVCCPLVDKPGKCPSELQAGAECGHKCEMDMDCGSVDKCCFIEECGQICTKPANTTLCLQQKAVVELLLSNNPGYEGYIPQCLENGEFSPKQCSINGHLCWCVTVNGTIVLGTMGPADGVQCEEPKQLETFTMPIVPQCEKLSCGQECETGYKYDGKGCRTCECAQPCEDIACPEGMECVLMKMDNCIDEYCPPVATCKDLTSNPCSWGKPLVHKDTNEQVKCQDNNCPNSHVCEFLHDGSGICCPKNIIIESTKPQECPTHVRVPETCDDICDSDTDCDGEMKCCPSKSCGAVCVSPKPSRLPTMCEYLRTEGLNLETEDGNITLAIPIPQCQPDGSYNPTQCSNNGECWCVDDFGVEIVGTKTSEQQNMDCLKVRDEMSCLGLICRLGCDFGFVMDEAGCPLCSCRNPCQNASCGPESTCQFLEVDCKEDWCPPLPHCIPLEVSARNFPVCPMGSPMMYEHDNQPVICDPFSNYPQCPSTHDCVVSDPRETGVCCPRAARDSEPLNKKGQCPYLIPLQSDSCDNECSSDRDCNDDQKCCSDGCGTHCVDPILKTACQHQRAATEHRTRELSIPASRVFLPKCDDNGDFSPIQCHPLTGNCWCVDKNGLEVPGTRAQNKQIVSCISEDERCPSLECDLSCISGYQLDNKGCSVCSCYDPCEDVECRNSGETCRLAQVNCISEPCPPIPLCLPRLENPCPVGEPLRDEDYGEPLQCGPNNNKCPSSHRCHLSPLEEYAVCCPQPKSTTCEQLKERNLKFKKHNRVAFIPKCNKKTGAWEPTQCMESLGLCWCVDSDGNQLPGTLIRGVPHCTARSAKSIEYIPICPGGEPVHICPETLCEGKICLAYPNASCHINPCGGCSVEFMDEINRPVNCNEGLTACFDEVQEIINNRISSSSQYLIDGDAFPVLEDNIREISTPPPAYPPPPPPPLMSMSVNRRQILHDYEYDEPQQHQDYNSFDPQYEHFDVQALHTEDHPVMLTPRLEGMRIQMTTRTQPIMEAFEIRPVVEIFHSQPQLEIVGISHQFTLVDRADHSLIVKPGLCPVPSLLSILHSMARGCMDECMTDMDCPGFAKCCLYSCGLSCVQPVLLPVLQSSSKVGKCPVLPQGGISPIACLLAKRECITDEDCGGMHKCCATACGFECMKAVEQKELVFKPVTLHASVPKCSAEGGYAITQQQGELSWCVDQFGNPLHDTLTRGTVECDINGTIIFQQRSGPVCQSPEKIPRVCKEECIEATCIQHPDAICVADPCKDCAVTFVSEEGSHVTCEEKCHQPLVIGNCRSSLPRYYFNHSSNKCEQFMFGGCQGNDNNFETLEVCKDECERQVPQCEQPKEVGLCRAQILRFFYNKERHQCEMFVYGGCGGNENNFETKADCERVCPDLVICPWINVKGQSLIPCSKSVACSNATCAGRSDAVCTVDSCSCEPVFVKRGLPVDCSSSISDSIANLRTAPIVKYTRCESLLKRHLAEGDSGYLPQCDENGQFFPVQCTQQKEPETQCWCVDEAGMQLPSTSLFFKGAKTCKFVKVKKVEVTLAFKHDDPLYSEAVVLDIKSLLEQFLKDIKAEASEVAIKVLPDATHVMFTLENDNKVQIAFQLEEMVRMQGMSIMLPKAEMVADYRASHFYHILDYEVDPDDVDNSVAANHISSVEFKEKEGSWPLFLVVVMAGIILFLGIIILVAITVRKRRQQEEEDKPKSSLVSMVFNNITYGVMGKKPVEKNLDAVPQVTVQTVEAQYESLQKKSDDQMSEVSEAPPAYDDVDEKEKSEKTEKH